MNEHTMRLVERLAEMAAQIQHYSDMIDALQDAINEEEMDDLETSFQYGRKGNEPLKLGGLISTRALKKIFSLQTSPEVMAKMDELNGRIADEAAKEANNESV